MPKIGHKCVFAFKFIEKLLFGRVSTEQKCFIGYVCQGAVVKVQKNGQKITKTGYTNTFALGNPSKHRQIKFSVD